MSKYKIYVASHFFSEAGLLWTEKLAQLIENDDRLCNMVDLYVPHRNDDINDKEANDDIITDIKICDADMEQLYSSDMVLGCIDGVEIDSGVAAEFGAAFMFNETVERNNLNIRKKDVLGIVTDMRYNGTGRNMLYRNLLITGIIHKHGDLLESPQILRDPEQQKELLDFIYQCVIKG